MSPPDIPNEKLTFFATRTKDSRSSLRGSKLGAFASVRVIRGRHSGNAYSLIRIKARHSILRDALGMNGQLFPPASLFSGSTQIFPEYTTELDARSPAPPNHLIAILTALAAVPPGAPQWVRTRTEPASLIRALSDQGVVAQTAELPDGSWRTILHRPPHS